MMTTEKDRQKIDGKFGAAVRGGAHSLLRRCCVIIEMEVVFHGSKQQW